MKKLFALLLCLVMVVSVLAGCGPTAPSGDNTTTGAANDTTASNIPEDVTLTIGVPQSGLVEDYDTNALTLWLEETTGYDLEFKVYEGTADDMKSQLSVAMVDGDELPDILLGVDLGAEVYEEYGEDGYFIDLKPYFEDKEGKAKVWWDRFNNYENETWRQWIWSQMVAGQDGGIYAFPNMESSSMDAIRYQAYINQDWLDKLGLPMPTDIESFYNTLVAFKTKDPNGNGQADEIPLVGNTKAYGDVVQYLINMFVYSENDYFHADDQGKLYQNYTSDEYREALKFINKLVKEGLLPTSAWSMDNKAVKTLVNPVDGAPQVAGVVLGHASVAFVTDNDAIFSYEAMPYWGYAYVSDQLFKAHTFITEDCEYPDAAWNLLMALASEEGAIRQRYGEKGVDWVDADPNTTSFVGKPAKIKVLNQGVWSDMNNQVYHNTVASIIIDSENESCQVDENTDDWAKHKYKLMEGCHEAFYKAAEKNPANAGIKFEYTDEETEHITVSMSNAQGIVKQARSSFSTGSGNDYTDPNDDAQWAAYVKAVEDEIATWQETAQAVYDWQYKN